MFTSVVWKENLILCKANPSLPQATPVLTQWLYPPLSYFQSALLRLWRPASKRSPHHCSSISDHCRLTHPWSVNGLLSWEPVCSATRCIHHPVASPVFLHFLFFVIFILFNFFLLTFSEPRFLSTALFFLSINPLPLELPLDATSRLVMEMACKIVLQCYEHC